jgi:hypothetical protein
METATPIDYKALYEQSQLQVLELTQQLQQLKKMIFGANKSVLFLSIQNLLNYHWVSKQS